MDQIIFKHTFLYHLRSVITYKLINLFVFLFPCTQSCHLLRYQNHKQTKKHAYQILCAAMATIHYVSTVYKIIARLSGKSMNAWLSKTVNGSFTTKQKNTFRLNFPTLYHMIINDFHFAMLNFDHFNVHKLLFFFCDWMFVLFCRRLL